MYVRPVRGGPAFYIALHACCILLKTGAPVLCPPFIAIPSPSSEFGGERTTGEYPTLASIGALQALP